MNAETPKPRKDDTVRIVLDGAAYVREGDPADHDGGFAGHLVRVEGVLLYVPLSASVEVLERADDPSKNPIGTVRREQHAEDETGEGYSVWQHTQYQLSASKARSHWLCTHSTHHGNLGESLTHDQVRSMPVIGAAPGTPAAEAQTPIAEWEPGPRRSVRVPNEPHGLPNEIRKRVADMLTAGDKTAAVRELHRVGVRDAAEYVESMPEYQTYLNHHIAERREREPEDHRTLLVHPHVWKSLVAYLDSIAVRVVEATASGATQQTFAMQPNDGEWP